MSMNIHIPKPLRQILMGLFILGVVVLLVSATHLKKSVTPSDFEIEIEALADGKNLLTEAEVFAQLQSSIGYHPVKLPIGEIPLSRFEEILNANPYIKDAKVYVDHRGVLHFKVAQRLPVLRLIESGSTHYIDSEGQWMPPSEHYTVRVPVLHGHIPKGDEREEWKKEELSLILESLNQKSEMTQWIDQVYRDQNGSYVLIPLLSKLKIDFGPWKNVGPKWEKMTRFFKEVLPKKGWNKYERIDLRFEDQVIAKMKV